MMNMILHRPFVCHERQYCSSHQLLVINILFDLFVPFILFFFTSLFQEFFFFFRLQFVRFFFDWCNFGFFLPQVIIVQSSCGGEISIQNILMKTLSCNCTQIFLFTFSLEILVFFSSSTHSSPTPPTLRLPLLRLHDSHPFNSHSQHFFFFNRLLYVASLNLD